MRSLAVSVLCLWLSGCDIASTPEPPAFDAPGGAPTLFVEPNGDPANAWPASRFRITPGRAELLPNEILLLEGEISAYHLRRIRERDLPKTLLERLVPTLVWQEEDAVIVAPTIALEREQTYSLAEPEAGLIGMVRVGGDAPPLLERIWPPRDAKAGIEHAVYCAREPIALPDEQGVWLEPGHLAAIARAGADDRGTLKAACLSLEPLASIAAGAAVLGPIALGSGMLEPGLLEKGAPPGSVAGVSCTAPETELGPGCVTVLDDRLVVRSIGSPALWVLGGDVPESVLVAKPDARVVVKGLTPQATALLEVGYFDLSGNRLSLSKLVTTAVPQSHVVINEVFADPLGAEPTQEWVELVNDGIESVDLAGFLLRDNAAETELPPFELAPGAFVLIARQDFVLDDGLGVPVPTGAPVIRVPAIGNGLSNAGERLELSRPDGIVTSVFPAVPKPKAGVSMARERPWLLDDDPDSFAYHAPPGASPGAPNDS